MDEVRQVAHKASTFVFSYWVDKPPFSIFRLNGQSSQIQHVIWLDRIGHG